MLLIQAGLIQFESSMRSSSKGLNTFRMRIKVHPQLSQRKEILNYANIEDARTQLSKDLPIVPPMLALGNVNTRAAPSVPKGPRNSVSHMAEVDDAPFQAVRKVLETSSFVRPTEAGRDVKWKVVRRVLLVVQSFAPITEEGNAAENLVVRNLLNRQLLIVFGMEGGVNAVFLDAQRSLSVVVIF
jgi:hypothetical protein